ncbi:unnamed protein product, partial [Amoebophrya sp. A25]
SPPSTSPSADVPASPQASPHPQLRPSGSVTRSSLAPLPASRITTAASSPDDFSNAAPSPRPPRPSSQLEAGHPSPLPLLSRGVPTGNNVLQDLRTPLLGSSGTSNP